MQSIQKMKVLIVCCMLMMRGYGAMSSQPSGLALELKKHMSKQEQPCRPPITLLDIPDVFDVKSKPASKSLSELGYSDLDYSSDNDDFTNVFFELPDNAGSVKKETPSKRRVSFCCSPIVVPYLSIFQPIHKKSRQEAVQDVLAVIGACLEVSKLLLPEHPHPYFQDACHMVVMNIESSIDIEMRHRCAVIIDIDETAVRREGASHVQIPLVHAFFKKIVQAGFPVFFISARPSKDLDYIYENILYANGYDIAKENIYLMPDELFEYVHEMDLERQKTLEQGVDALSLKIHHTVGTWKESIREKIESADYSILCVVDDNQYNLEGNACGIGLLMKPNLE